MCLRPLLHLFALVAMLVAPLGMVDDHAAAAAPQASAGGHCADMTGSRQQAPDDKAPGKSIDCMIACACVPSPGVQLAEPPLALAGPQPAMIVSRVGGINPAADPPPPRLS
ncbi:MAG TPA: hypothetical protein VGC46_00420 [Allosphingosinicella sp.]